MAPRISVETRDGLGFLIFDHPERRNALTQQMWREIPDAAAQLAADANVRVVVLRGAGETAFVSGADISEFEHARTRDNVAAYDELNERAYAALLAIDKPVIAMIHGFCVGGGAAIALTADLRYAADDSLLGIPAARLGLGYSYAGVAALCARVGAANAKEIFFTAKRFAAPDALRMGLLNGVFPKASLEAEVLAIAEMIADNAPMTLRAIKLAIRELEKVPAERRLEPVENAIGACYDSEDYKEGIAAFLEKRRPVFGGK